MSKKLEKMEKARQLFLDGANCAQAVLCAFTEETGLDTATSMKIASGFGGGMARMREVCGAVSGMFMAYDMICGTASFTDKEAKDALYKKLQSLAGEFKKENSSIICKELLALSLPSHTPDTPVSEVRTPQYYRKRPCADLVAAAAGILQEELNVIVQEKGSF